MNHDVTMGMDMRSILYRRRKPDARPAWIPPGEHFVMVVEDDSAGFNGIDYDFDAYGMPVPRNNSKPGPITWEHYIGPETSIDAVREKVRRHGSRYGRTAIARLEFYL